MDRSYIEDDQDPSLHESSLNEEQKVKVQDFIELISQIKRDELSEIF